MDYSKLSDFEINSAVHNALMKEPYKIEFLGNDRIRWVKGRTDVTTEKVAYSKNSLKDYCNNPSDAWPIILANKINIRFGAEGFRHEAQFIQYGRESVEAYHENPLRAAMVVFLMMQEGK